MGSLDAETWGRVCTALCFEIHEPWKKDLENTDLCLKLNIILKIGIFTGWNSRKSGRPNFWRFWKSKIGTFLIKLGRLAGMLLGCHNLHAYTTKRQRIKSTWWVFPSLLSSSSSSVSFVRSKPADLQHLLLLPAQVSFSSCLSSC